MCESTRRVPQLGLSSEIAHFLCGHYGRARYGRTVELLSNVPVCDDLSRTVFKYSDKIEPVPFRNLMVNVLFTHPAGEADTCKTFSVVGELQLTTVAGVKVKKVQHKIYTKTRALLLFLKIYPTHCICNQGFNQSPHLPVRLWCMNCCARSKATTRMSRHTTRY